MYNLVVFSVSAAAASIIFKPLKEFFDIQTNKIFYRDGYNSEQLIDEINQVAITGIDTVGLLDKVSTTLESSLKVEFCGFTLAPTTSSAYRQVRIPAHYPPEAVKALEDEAGLSAQKSPVSIDELDNDPHMHSLMRRAGTDVLIPLVTQNRDSMRNIGYMLLGSKRSGGVYTKNDYRVLKIIAGEVAIAVENALHYEEIQNFNQTLERRVEDATRKLKRANERLVRLDETKDEFISMASHQLRTPLTSIKGYVSMVLDGDAGKLTAQQTDMLKQSFMSSQRMVNLIADLLNLSRLNNGRFAIESSPVDLRTIVGQEYEQLSEAAKAKSIEFIYEPPAHFPTLLLDDNKLHQVVMNFMDNAIFYTPTGGRVEVVLRETQYYVEYLVKDTGIGVPREEQRHLFTKYYRAENAKRARPDGTGLGLFMAKKVIVAQGGAVVFESHEGRGSTFGFKIGKRKAALPAAMPEVS